MSLFRGGNLNQRTSPASPRILPHHGTAEGAGALLSGGNMATLQTSNGHTVQVDDADLAMVNCYSWHAERHHGKWRVRGWIGSMTNGTRRRVEMARLIMGEPARLQVDHVHGNGLDCRRSELRLATNQQNNRNRHKTRGASRFKGVVRCGRKWQAKVKIDGKSRSLGSFATEEQAALAYNTAALEAFGEFARPNVL